MTMPDLHKGNARHRILCAAQPLMASRGFSAVGLNEVLSVAGVPKGSFYHYFSSKDAFGQALLQGYFDESLDELERVLQQRDLSMGDRVMSYWQHWADSQMGTDPHEKCLVVKLGAEVADLSEAMREVLCRGTARIIDRLSTAISDGIAEKSIFVSHEPTAVARTLYQTWLGASVMTKIMCSRAPFDNAASAARHMLQPISGGMQQYEPSNSPR